MKVNSLSWAASDNLKQVRMSMNETGAWVHEVWLLFVCRVECSGMRVVARWYGRMFVAGLWCGVMLLCMRCLSCDIAVVWTYVCCRVLLPHDVGWCCCRCYCIDVLLCGDCGGNVAVVWMMFVAGLVMLGDVVVHEVDCHVVDRGGWLSWCWPRNVWSCQAIFGWTAFGGMVMFKKIWKFGKIILCRIINSQWWLKQGNFTIMR